MKESEQNQEACYLDMDPGLHVDSYTQRFVKASRSAYPEKNSRSGMECEPSKIMGSIGM